MEADWEVEIDGEAPIIDAHWPGFIDLRLHPDRAAQLPEAAQLPALADTLVRINSLSSPVWTAKCDAWPVHEFDPDELDAPPQATTHALACYIDLLPVSSDEWPTPDLAIAWCKGLCDLLHARPLRQCRADLIVRQALISPDHTGLGVTVYLSACGQTPGDAAAVLSSGLALFADSIQPTPPPAPSASKLQWESVGE